VKPEVAQKQIDMERPQPPPPPPGGEDDWAEIDVLPPSPPSSQAPRCFHGSVRLDPLRAGSEAGRVSDEVLSHLAGLIGADVIISLEIDARIPQGAPEHVVRTVTENSRTLRFDDAGFEAE
jgi:hypothetical protein